MLKKRIIACLDIQEGRTVKGINFKGIRDAGDPVELGAKYAAQGVDELVFLDITATIEKRKTLIELVRKISTTINIPFTVGGGIRSVDDVAELLNAGADKISINSAAVRNPELIRQIANRFGSQCVVVAIDTKQTDQREKVFIKGGREETQWETINWAQQCVDYGAGEILLTSMNKDGTKDGFDLGITQKINEAISIPVIASGGAGTKQHFAEAFQKTQVDACLAASIFHFGEISIPELKTYLTQQNIPIRCN